MLAKKKLILSSIQQCHYWIFAACLFMFEPALAREWNQLYRQPTISARAAVLMNANTGHILFSKEPNLRLPPASTTKVLTALLVMEHLSLNDQIVVSSKAANAPPSRIGLRAGEIVSTHDLLYGLLLKSGNDAAEALAEAVGGSIYGFSNLMNSKVWQLGAHNSHFMNPHGLPHDNHYSTAYDLALIFRNAMQNSVFADIVRTRNAALRIDSGRDRWDDGRLILVHNTNKLLESYEGTRGGKTGFTIKARRCFVGEVDRGGTKLIVSVMNSPNSITLWRDARLLLDYGFTISGIAIPIMETRAPFSKVKQQSIPIVRSHYITSKDQKHYLANPIVKSHISGKNNILIREHKKVSKQNISQQLQHKKIFLPKLGVLSLSSKPVKSVPKLKNIQNKNSDSANKILQLHTNTSGIKVSKSKIH